MTRTRTPLPCSLSGRALRDRRAATLVRLLAQVPGKAIESVALTMHVHGLVCRTQGLHGFSGSIIVERRLWVPSQKRGLRPRLGGYAGVSGYRGEWRHRGPQGCW